MSWKALLLLLLLLLLSLLLLLFYHYYYYYYHYYHYYYYHYYYYHACMQAALPCLIMAQANSSPAEQMPDGQTSVVELRGGTDAAMAPPVSYIEQVLLPMLQRLQGVKASIDLQRRGFFPKV